MNNYTFCKKHSLPMSKEVIDDLMDLAVNTKIEFTEEMRECCRAEIKKRNMSMQVFARTLGLQTKRDPEKMKRIVENLLSAKGRIRYITPEVLEIMKTLGCKVNL